MEPARSLLATGIGGFEMEGIGILVLILVLLLVILLLIRQLILSSRVRKEWARDEVTKFREDDADFSDLDEDGRSRKTFKVW